MEYLGFTTVKKAQELLPEVGDELMRVPTFGMTLGEGPNARVAPRHCVVTLVNREHLWYQVQFDNGIKECYKVPACPRRKT